MTRKFIGIIGFVIFVGIGIYFISQDEEINVICNIEDQTIVCKE